MAARWAVDDVHRLKAAQRGLISKKPVGGSGWQRGTEVGPGREFSEKGLIAERGEFSGSGGVERRTRCGVSRDGGLRCGLFRFPCEQALSP